MTSVDVSRPLLTEGAYVAPLAIEHQIGLAAVLLYLKDWETVSVANRFEVHALMIGGGSATRVTFWRDEMRGGEAPNPAVRLH